MNIFYWIFIIDMIAFGILFGLGHYAKERYFKDTWNRQVSKEVKQCRKDEKEWKKNHPILAFLEGFYYDLRWRKDIPMDKYREIKWFIQRGKRGYADYDVWGFHSYLTNIISKGIKDLKVQVHGVPSDVHKKMNESYSSDLKKSIKEWKRILGEIQWTFETAKKIDEGNLLYIEDERSRKRIEKTCKILNIPIAEEDKLFPEIPDEFYTVMTKEECKRYKNGWKLFQKYYFSLWD